MEIKICAVTSTRADYGLLHPLLKRMQHDIDIDLNILVTGTHLDQNYGYTISEIISDNIIIHEKIIIESNISITTSISKSLILFENYLKETKPDLLLVLGDRFEIYTISLAAYLNKIKIAHISGGEVTSGAFDDMFRHSITKMSSLHFTSHKKYRDRVIQLGESPNTVFNVGALSVENKNHYIDIDFINDIPINKEYPTALCTFHPITNGESTLKTLSELLSALENIELNVIFTGSNMDTNGTAINTEIIKRIENGNSNWFYFPSLGKDKYFSALKRVDFVIGNSSSGISEAPMFGIPSIDIGSRQNGRNHPITVIQTGVSKNLILSSIEKAISEEFKAKCLSSAYFLGDGSTSLNILKTIKSSYKSTKIEKVFHDLELKV
jgi:GDP/UDP-N,N'-diacetylbacillosamine 2-epimerase (hydrolysing)